MKPVAIAGGGLAGLALGRALAARGCPVSVADPGPYPRHRVCGEFIAGLDDATTRSLDLTPLLDGATRLHTTAWFHKGRSVYHARLPHAALGISRHRLDRLLARSLTSLGGSLLRQRTPAATLPAEGTVDCSGRRRGPSGWIGLKVHLLQPQPLAADLEVHLGHGAYVGLSPVEDGRANLCGLFRQRAVTDGGRTGLLWSYLAAAGLGDLAARCRDAHPDAESFCAVAGLDYRPARPTRTLACGDAAGLIPPFTGHGMALALASSAAALDALHGWSSGASGWAETIAVARRRQQLAAASRRPVARALHPFLLARPGQHLLAALASARLLPFAFLYRLTHGRPTACASSR